MLLLQTCPTGAFCAPATQNAPEHQVRRSTITASHTQTGLAALQACRLLLLAHTGELPLGATQINAAHLYSCCRRARKFWKSPIKSFSFLDSAAVMAVRVRSLEEPGPQPCRGTKRHQCTTSKFMLEAVPGERGRALATSGLGTA